MNHLEVALQPEDVTRLVAERFNHKDAAAVAQLYEAGAVLAYPLEHPVSGRPAIQDVYQRMIDLGVTFGTEVPLPTVRFENLALTSTRSRDGVGIRVQIVRQQSDGTWLRVIDRPEVPGSTAGPTSEQ